MKGPILCTCRQPISSAVKALFHTGFIFCCSSLYYLTMKTDKRRSSADVGVGTGLRGTCQFRLAKLQKRAVFQHCWEEMSSAHKWQWKNTKLHNNSTHICIWQLRLWSGTSSRDLQGLDCEGSFVNTWVVEKAKTKIRPFWWMYCCLLVFLHTLY